MAAVARDEPKRLRWPGGQTLVRLVVESPPAVVIASALSASSDSASAFCGDAGKASACGSQGGGLPPLCALSAARSTRTS